MLPTLAAIAAAGGGLFTLALTVDFWRDSERAMRRATHRAEMLPKVMIGRYAAFTALAAGAALSGDPAIILFLFAVFLGLSLYDTLLYARAGHAWGPHALAAVLCLLPMGFAAAALVVS